MNFRKMMDVKLEVKIVGLVIIVLLLSSIMAGLFSTRFIKGDIEKIMFAAGESLAHGVGVYNLPKEAVELLGRFKYRYYSS